MYSSLELAILSSFLEVGKAFISTQNLSRDILLTQESIIGQDWTPLVAGEVKTPWTRNLQDFMDNANSYPHTFRSDFTDVVGNH